MTSTIRPIETRYAGCRFRSRLEARWAVFFDTLGVRWEYEPEGFVVSMAEDENGEILSSRAYLPDFWLPDLETYVEVKGSDDQVDDGYRAMLANAIDYGATPLYKGLLLLGPVPDPTQATRIFHHQLYHRKGVACRSVSFALRPVGRAWVVTLEESSFPLYFNGNGAGSSAPDLPHDVSWEALAIRVETVHSGEWWRLPKSIADAYTAARSARFEHGEHG